MADSRVPAIVCVVLTCCATSPSKAPSPSTASVPPAVASTVAVGRSALTGSIKATPAAGEKTKGQLVVGWLSVEQANDWNEGRVEGATLRDLFARFRFAGEVDVAAPNAAYRVEAPADGVPFVLVDVDRSFWRTLSGAGSGFIGVGKVGGGEIVVKAHPKKPTTAEPCAGERMELVTIDAPEIAGTVGNPTQRRFCAFLPPSYATSPARRYPVVFLFGGFMSNEMVRFRGKTGARDVADDVARETGREAILVGVDASTQTGSTYLEDSPLTGQWDKFMAGRALEVIDARFRTLKVGTGRAIVGQSTGGHIAVSFAMRHPDLFGAIGATAPDALDIEPWLFEAKDRPTPWVLSLARLENALGGPGQMISYSVDWTPNVGGPYEWPFDLATGAARPVILARWKDHSPAHLLDDVAKTKRVRDTFSGRILLAISEHDEFGLTEPARIFSQKLKNRGIDHELDVTPEGHLAGGAPRTAKAIRFVISHITKAAP